MIPQTAIEAAAMIAAGFIFNIIETAYFGWNIKPSFTEEMICDYIASALILGGTIWLAILIRWEK